MILGTERQNAIRPGRGTSHSGRRGQGRELGGRALELSFLAPHPTSLCTFIYKRMASAPPDSQLLLGLTSSPPSSKPQWVKYGVGTSLLPHLHSETASTATHPPKHHIAAGWLPRLGAEGRKDPWVHGSGLSLLLLPSPAAAAACGSLPHFST